MTRALNGVLLMLSACGAATGPLIDEEHRDAARPRDAGRADAGVSLDAGARPDGLVFRLSFRSDVGAAESIYVQQSTSSREGPGWLSVRTTVGESIQMSARCDLCACPTAGGRCLDCPRCGPPPDFVAALIGSGDRIEYRWDGLGHTSDTCDAGELALCAAPPTAAPPGDYVATFCWSPMATGVGMGETVGMITCDEVSFRLPDDDGLVEDTLCWCG